MLNKLFSAFFPFFYNAWFLWWFGSMKRTLPCQSLNGVRHLEPHAPKMLPYITTFLITPYPRISIFVIPSRIVNNPTYFTSTLLFLPFFCLEKTFKKEFSGIIFCWQFLGFIHITLKKFHIGGKLLNCTSRCPKVYIGKLNNSSCVVVFKSFIFLHNPLMWLLRDLQQALEFS